MVLAFDVYGTLIDPLRIEETLRPFFGERARPAAELWRAKQLEYSFRRALMKRYKDFNVCTAEALQLVSDQMRVALSAEQRSQILQQYGRLPAYPDAAPALRTLNQAGCRMVACSNGTEAAVRGLLQHAALWSQLSAVVSVDGLQTFKPDPAVYEYLSAQAGTAKDNLWLISSNPFDVIGAKACGLRSAWVRRDSDRVFDPWEFQPDLIVQSLEELPARLALQS